MQADIAISVKGGQRLVYNCGHDWSFLKPVATLTLPAGASTLPLPDDYAAADGPIQIGVASSSSYYHSLVLGPWQPIYQMESRQPGQTGIPQYVCEQVTKGTTPTAGQRMVLHFFPAADQDYQLNFAYRLNVDATSGALPYLYGGSQHSELFLAACKAAAERDIDNIPAAAPNAVHQQSFAALLEAAKMLDRRSKPHTVGRMPATGLYGNGQPYIRRPLLPILVQGVLYD